MFFSEIDTNELILLKIGKVSPFDHGNILGYVPPLYYIHSGTSSMQGTPNSSVEQREIETHINKGFSLRLV
jgi:hypothetical protein